MRAAVAASLFLLWTLAGSQVGAQEARVAELIDQLQRPATAREAVDQLAAEGPAAARAVPALVQILKTGEPDLRWRAARTLGALGPAAASAAADLVQALSSAQPQERAYAAFALGRIGVTSDQVVERLVAVAFDSDPLVRRAAMRAVRALDLPQERTLPLVIRLLEEGEPAAVMAALHTLAEEGADAVPRLRQALGHPRAAHWASVVLAEIGPAAAPAVPELTQVVRHDDPDTRLHALLALGEIGAAAGPAVPAILDALRGDPFREVRLAAAVALAKIQSPGDADDAALRELAGSDDAFVKTVALWALARMHPEDGSATQNAVTALVAALRSDDKFLRGAAARGLAELQVDPDVVGPELVRALEDADPTVAGNALDALAALGPRVLDRAVAALADPQRRLLAMRVIARMGAQARPAVPRLAELLAQPVENDQDRAFQRELRLALAAMGPAASEAVPALIQSLRSEVPELRHSAAYVLAKIRAEAALPQLRELAASDNERTRLLGLWALLQFDSADPELVRRAVPALTAALRSEDELVRYEAVSTLGDLGPAGRPALEAVRSLTQDPSQSVRQAAAEAVAKLEAR